MASQVATVELYKQGDTAEFVFLTDQVVSASDVSVFEIQPPTSASITGTEQEPFCNLKGSSITFSEDSNSAISIVFDDNYTSALSVVSYINEAVSGFSSGAFTSEEMSGFVVIKAQSKGFSSSLSSLSVNTILGFDVTSSSGSDQEKISVSPDMTVNTVATGVVAVTFPIDPDLFLVDHTYFLELDDGVNQFLLKFKVVADTNYVSVNFVG